MLLWEEIEAVDFGHDPEHVDYDKMYANRFPLLRKAYERSGIANNPDYQRFICENGWWLDDYALFMSLKSFFDQKEWPDWPEDISRHWNNAVEYYHRELYYDVEFHKYTQFKFYEQWYALKAYANGKHIRIIGDIPIYVSFDSTDVWAHSELFQLNDQNRQRAVAGCPPDAFSAEGQIWGTPLYRWEKHRDDRFGWWMARLWMAEDYHRFKKMAVPQIMEKMIAFSKGYIHDIDHFIRVWTYARIIGKLERLDEDTQFIRNTAGPD